MVNAFKYCMKNWNNFSGRGDRAEYWWFYLALQIISLPGAIFLTIYFVTVMVSFEADEYGNVLPGQDFSPLLGVGIAYLIFFIVGLVFTVPAYAAAARRLHDMGQSGHWLWLNLAGFGIVTLIMCIMESQPFDNRWGPYTGKPRAFAPQAYPATQAPQYAVPPTPTMPPQPPPPPSA